VAPLQDLLALGPTARMNTPGVAAGNWSWRVQENQLTLALMDRLGELTELFSRVKVKPT